MTRKNSVFALIGCSLAFTSLSALAGADDAVSGSAEGAEISAPAATGAVAKTASATVFAWPKSQSPVRKVKEKGLKNFGKLNEHIWRSGQPSMEGYARLKEMGVKTIVNLRKEAPADSSKLPEGINYVNIPIVDEKAPTAEQAQEFLEIASNPDNWPLLVHCHGGEGRAGVMSALVRFAFDGWDEKKIAKETDTFRVAYLGLFKTRMCAPQREFLKEWSSSHKAGEYSQKFARSTEVVANK